MARGETAQRREFHVILWCDKMAEASTRQVSDEPLVIVLLSGFNEADVNLRGEFLFRSPSDFPFVVLTFQSAHHMCAPPT